MKRLNNRSAAVFSHGVAEEVSPRREPWVGNKNADKPRQGRQKTQPSGFFRRSAALAFSLIESHGSRRGLSSFAAPQLLCAGLVVCSFTLVAAALPADWQYDQSFTVTAPGLAKFSLPIKTLDAARPALEDLRLYDDAGTEVPYLIERPAPTTRHIQTVKSFQTSLQTRSTVITIETGLTQPLDTLSLETPATDFLKPVRVEGSTDGRNWQILAQGQPIFRQLNGANHLQVSFPSGTWAWLRLTVDDQRQAPISFTGARVHAIVVESAPTERMPVTISERHENPGETRLSLNLGAANLSIASVQIETAEPLFTRPVMLAVPQISEDAVREQTIGQGTIYRIAVEDQTAADNLSVPLENIVRSRELLLFIKNQDSPPLPITGVKIERRPVYLVFLARQPGTYHVLTGNPRCVAPHYDLAALGMNLKTVPVYSFKLTPTDNPNYRAPEVLPGIEDGSSPLDVAAWKFRKPVNLLKLTLGGAQRVALDLEVRSRAQPNFADLRIMREGRQIPYILEHPSITDVFSPLVTVTNDAKDPKLSRWIIHLPEPNLPVLRLAGIPHTALFEREMTLYEEATDERGGKYRHTVGQALWVQRPDHPTKEFIITVNGRLQTDTLFLETHNGDNPPIEMSNVRLFFPVTRVLFKAQANDKLFVYYGNPQASAPRYDLSLVADQLLTAKQWTDDLSAQEQLRKSSWRDNELPGQGGVVFWGILAVVVVVLLVIISRLLPRASPPP